MNYTSKTRILVAEDNQMFRTAISCLLNSKPEFEVVAQASNGEEAIEKSLNNDIDIIIMDVDLPKLDGSQATRIILDKKPSIKILALTWKEDELSVVKTVRAGALGYVLKNTSSGELVLALKALSNGNSYFSKDVSQKLLAQLDPTKSNQRADTFKNKTITPREMQILEFITEELTNKEIAEQLFISPRTVETHRRNLIQKLKVKNTVGLVKYYLNIHKQSHANLLNQNIV